jgi:hypothetical protein
MEGNVLKDRQPFQKVSNSPNQMSFLDWYKVWNFEFRYLIIGQVSNSFCGPLYVSLEVLSIKHRTLQMLPNLSNEMTTKNWCGYKLISRENNLRLAFYTIPISMKSAGTIYISSAVSGCHSFTHYLEKILSPKFLKCSA